MVDVPITEIIYCAPESSYPDLTECPVPVKFIDCMPDRALISDKKPRIVVIDDLMSQQSGDSLIDLYTKDSHHCSASVLFICQNIFYKGKAQRDISLNSHYLAIFKNPRDRRQFGTLSSQICPQNAVYMNEIFADATSVPYGYLLLDLTQTTPDHQRYRTNIFPDDVPSNIVYVPKNYIV